MRYLLTTLLALTTLTAQAQWIGRTPRMGGWQRSLVLAYDFDVEGTGLVSVVRDSSTQGNDGTVSGNPVNQSATGANGTDSFKLDGTGDYIYHVDDDSLDVGTGNFAISVWIKTTQGTTGIIVQKRSGGLKPGYQLAIYGGGILEIFVQEGAVGGSSTAYIDSSASTYDDGKWHHVVCGRDGSNLRLYIDGAQDANSPASLAAVGTTLSGTTDFLVGAAYGGSSYYNGQLDDLRIYKRWPSAAEIYALYIQGKQ